MTYLVNSPKEFATDSLKGMVLANGRYLQAVHGGVVRSTSSPDGEVSVVVGGGSGHYPAFAGWVGPGLAHGSVCGNIFASPSASQVRSVVEQADNGGGTLLLFGNYAGDVLHFGAAAKSLNDDGIDTRIVLISDDIASNTPDKHDDRRGIAGDIMVVKVAGAAAAAGLDLDNVERVARKANSSTRTLGVAFTGCTLPGSAEPLFAVPQGHYALGLGIHGEPGITTHPMTSAKEIGDLLVDRLLAEEPKRNEAGYGGRVAVLVNGLGATKYEELFVLFGSIAETLEENGFTLVNPVVGEQVTSLDMAGASLTLMFLDDELEEYWLAPADSPAFKLGAIKQGAARRVVIETKSKELPVGSPESAAQAAKAVSFVELLATVSAEKEDELGNLDSIAGDGDHGQGMSLGSAAAARVARELVAHKVGMHTLFAEAGAAWAEGAGGTSGAAWGAAVTAMGQALSDERAATDEEIGRASVSAVRAFSNVGTAVPGDKTMIDATHPFAEELEARLDRGDDLASAWCAAAAVAMEAAEATAKMIARKGRARTHGAASIGTPDPGAISFSMLMTAVGEALLSDPSVDHQTR